MIKMPVIWDAVVPIMTSEMDNSIYLQKSWIGHYITLEHFLKY